jgi:hypothetical protein
MWTPLLTGSLAEKARSSVVEIAEGLRAVDPVAEFEAPGEPAPDATVASGASGVALAMAYLDDTGSCPGGRAKAAELFEFSAEVMASVRLKPALLDGFTGIGWVAGRVLPGASAAEEDDPLSDIDDELLAALSPAPWTSDYDLVSGLVGLGLFALDRLPRPAARAALSAIVGHLNDASEPAGGGVTWHTPPELLTGSQRETYPYGHYNLGLAHGVPGIVGFLGQVCAARIPECDEPARRLLSGAVSWLLENRQEGPARFPYCTGPGVPLRESRSAWCYGDPGVAAALLVAARTANEPSWEREAVEMALHAASRAFEQSGAIDPGLCHGTAGVAHIFNRFFQATGIPGFSRAATSWFEKTLEMRSAGAGVAGYSSAVKALDDSMTYRRDATFLTGAAGIAMALAAATTSTQPDWDQLLLLSSVRGRWA